jgi:hypothetical protein
MIDYDNTATYYRIGKNSNDDGGAQMAGYSEGGIGIEIVTRTTTDTTGTSTSTQGPLNIVCQKANGQSIQAIPADKIMVTIRNSGDTRFIFNSNGTAYADDSWSTFSDERLKKDIEDIPYGLDEINKLQPKIFTKHSGDFDDDGNVVLEDNGKRKIGFIAQEIKEVVPEMITNPNEDLTEGFYALDDGKLTSVLVKAVQELSAKVEQLENKLGE